MLVKSIVEMFKEECERIDQQLLVSEGTNLDQEIEDLLSDIPVVEYVEKVQRINLYKFGDNYLTKYSDVREYCIDNDIEDITCGIANIAKEYNIEESSIVLMIDSKESILEACKKEGCAGKRCTSEELKQLKQKNVKIVCKQHKESNKK